LITKRTVDPLSAKRNCWLDLAKTPLVTGKKAQDLSVLFCKLTYCKTSFLGLKRCRPVFVLMYYDTIIDE